MIHTRGTQDNFPAWDVCLSGSWHSRRIDDVDRIQAALGRMADGEVERSFWAEDTLEQ